MPSVFSRIIAGELPGRIVDSDDFTVSLLTIAPLRPGHTLVVPRREVDSWLDMSPEELAAMWAAAQRVGKAIDRAFSPRKVAAMLLGLEVPHVHLHLVPIDSEEEVRFDRVDANPDPAALDEAQRHIVEQLG